MRRKTFTSNEWLHLTELAHAAVLGGLMNARRWAPGELKFQGGTSLHLIYGSPRFSEDLDFVTATEKGLHTALKGALPYVKSAFAREYPALVLTLKARDDESAAEPRNPRLFTVKLHEPDWERFLTVKVDFFVAKDSVVQAYQSGVKEVVALRPSLRVDLASTQVETAVIEEILCDKLHALGDRERLKERDVFDLWWICQQKTKTPSQAASVFAARHANHMLMYPNGKNLAELAVALNNRANTMQSILGNPDNFLKTAENIRRWLPQTNGKPHLFASTSNVQAMVEHAVQCARETAAVAETLSYLPIHAEAERVRAEATRDRPRG